MTKLLLSLITAAHLLRADFDPERWQWRRTIDIKQPSAVSAVVVDPSIYRTSYASLNDLRVVHGDAEAPYQLQPLSGTREHVELHPVMLNKEAVAQTGVQAVLDLRSHPSHNRIHIATAQRNFKETVRVETSDDNRNWATVRDDGLIFDISRTDRAISDLTVDYPASTRRYVRITIPGWSDPASLTAAWLTYFKETKAVRDTVATLPTTASENIKAQTTSFVADIGFAGLAYDRIDLSAEPGLFWRSVEVSVSNDGKEWRFAAQGAISRTAQREDLSLEFSEQWSRYIKVTVFNGDDAPLKLSQFALSAVRRLLRFPSAAAGTYWLYSGNVAARAPSYDFARVTPLSSGAPTVSLAPAEPNPRYRPPSRPWTDRNPDLLNFVLIVAVLVMGLVTIRFLRKVKA